MSETHVAHTKVLSRMHSLSESHRESKVTKPILVILSVAAKCVHVRKKHVVIGGKRDMFCPQTIKVWSRWLLST